MRHRRGDVRNWPKRRILTIFALLLGATALSSGSTDVFRPTDAGSLILVTPNIDDDDGDGTPDAADHIINGPADREDLTVLEVPFPVKGGGQFVVSGPGASLYRVVELNPSDQMTTEVLVEAKSPRSDRSAATLTFEGPSPGGKSVSFRLDVKPFSLTCSLDPVHEVFVVEVPRSKRFIEELRRVLSAIEDAPKLTVLKVENGSRRDVWIQDATEIGVFADTSIWVALAGLRAKFRWLETVHLDRHFVSVFPGHNRCVLSVGEPLAERRWIDWFGNLEVTPALRGRDQEGFPFGRVLTGRQKELALQAEVMDFLKAQGVQWPPIVLDTSFLMIGHVDEVVNFLPSGEGFKAVLASPAMGRALLERLRRDGHGQKVILKGKEKAQRSVAEVLGDAKLMAANEVAARVMSKNRQELIRHTHFGREDLIELPVVVRPNGMMLWPNPVNGLVVGRHYILSKPFGPIVDGGDAVEEACRRALAETGAILHFLDAYDAYSANAGEVHCGTNAVRHRTRR